jgi:sulfite reductase (NADPH) hemoprotein beta-component
MYRYDDHDRSLVAERAAQYRGQLERHQQGRLSADEFRPLRLQNGWYIQRHAPMLRVAIPYGVLRADQLDKLADIADRHDRGYGHFTTRQNIQFNWIALERSADVLDELAGVDMHGIQTSGNCIRNITTDALAGVAVDEIADPRPWCELLRQWSTLHPEFAFLPRKFKIAVSGAREDRAATAWHDIGLQLRRDDSGRLGFRVLVGGGMGRTPVIGTVVREFLPADGLLAYCDAILRVYNRHGRRDNLYKARIKILVRALGARFVDEVEAEFEAVREALPLPWAELERIAAHFAPPVAPLAEAERRAAAARLQAAVQRDAAFARWHARNVEGGRLAGHSAVTLSLKRAGSAPGDLTSTQMRAVAALARRFSAGEIRVTHTQNLLLPWVRDDSLPQLWQQARTLGLAQPTHELLADMIACPGGDFCALANARSLPVAEALLQRYDDLDYLHDLGELRLNISGCINSCGHHHAGHIGILGVDKDGSEWYQVTIGGSSGAGGLAATPGRVIGPSFAAEQVPGVVDALLTVYLRERRDADERFVDVVGRIGVEPFKAEVYGRPHAAASVLAREVGA